MKVNGLKLISTSKQLERGHLIFKDDMGQLWGIFSTGYVRKWYGSHGWQVVFRSRAPQYEQKGTIDDEDYIELARILSEKIRKAQSKPEFRISYVNSAYNTLLREIRNMMLPADFISLQYTQKEIAEAIKKLYDKYVKE